MCECARARLSVLARTVEFGIIFFFHFPSMYKISVALACCASDIFNSVPNEFLCVAFFVSRFLFLSFSFSFVFSTFSECAASYEAGAERGKNKLKIKKIQKKIEKWLNVRATPPSARPSVVVYVYQISLMNNKKKISGK